MTSPLAVAEYVQALQRFPHIPGLFNQYAQHNATVDATPKAPDIRSEQLYQYLCERLGKVHLCLQAEAAGYQGARFSGIPMTSERILLGHHAVPASLVMKAQGQRTSRTGTGFCKDGFTEPTATVVWRAIAQAHVRPTSVVLSNTVPFHPFGAPGPLSNKKPSSKHVDATRDLLDRFYDLFPGLTIVPVGRVSEQTLKRLGFGCAPYVQHPSFGGLNAFRSGVAHHFGAARS